MLEPVSWDNTRPTRAEWKMLDQQPVGVAECHLAQGLGAGVQEAWPIPWSPGAALPAQPTEKPPENLQEEDGHGVLEGTSRLSSNVLLWASERPSDGFKLLQPAWMSGEEPLGWLRPGFGDS